MDWIPGISQLKSTVQLVCGDADGALKTQENFVRQCPVVSQVTSAVQLIAGDEEGAVETQKQCLNTISNFADGIPVVGHVKGVVHYACGDEDGGDRAMLSATRTTAVMGAGAAGIVVGGPVGAVSAGIGAGALYDSTITVATNRPHGIINAIDVAVKDPSPGNIFDAAMMPVGDGLCGVAGGKLAQRINAAIKANKAARMANAGAANIADLEQAGRLYEQSNVLLEEAEASRGLVPDKLYMDKANKAMDLYNEARTLEGKAPGNAPQPKPATSGGAQKPAYLYVPGNQQSTETVKKVTYIKRQKSVDGFELVELAIPDEDPHALAVFFVNERSPPLLREQYANRLMSKLDNLNRGLLHILHCDEMRQGHRDDFIELGLFRDSTRPGSRAEQLELRSYLYDVMQQNYNFLGRFTRVPGKRNYGWRVIDRNGTHRILIICCTTQQYELNAPGVNIGRYREIITAYLLPENDQGQFEN